MTIVALGDSYQHWESEARARQGAPAVQHPRGDVRLCPHDIFRLTIRVGYGPLPIELSRQEAVEAAQAILKLDIMTATARPEE